MIKITDSVAIYDTAELLEVTGRELAASDIIPAIGDRKTVHIIADRFHLNAMISVPEGAVTLMARHLIAADGSGIDVSGINGLDAPQTPKPKPVDASAPAPDGSAGLATGGDGGTVVLVAHRLEGSCNLLAKGGRGGQGQPGGDAADGAHGWPHDIDGRSGGNGGNAGPIGRAGASRDSGRGGSIAYFVATGDDGITTSVAGGPEVPAVSHGQAGTPGQKGIGGREIKCDIEDRPPWVGLSVGPDLQSTMQPLRHPRTCYTIDRRLPNGSPGAPSLEISEAPVAGAKGDDGQVRTGEPSEHGGAVSLRGLRWLLLESEILHIQAMGAGQDAQEAALAAIEMSGFVFVLCMGSGRPELLEVAGRASALMHRITSGSPPEGTKGLEVSLNPLSVLLESTRLSLESRWRSTTYIDALRQDTRDERAVQMAIGEVRKQSYAVQSAGEARLVELFQRRETVVKTVNELSSNYAILWKEVLIADAAFQEAVRRKNPCAQFLDIVMVAGAIAVTVMTGGAAAAGAIAAGGEVLAFLEKDQARKEAYEKKVKEAGGLKTSLLGHAKTAQDFVGKVSDLKKLLGGDELTPPSDHVKVSMSRDDFNKMIEPYRGMGATEELKTRMDRFFSLTETRNSLLLEHDQIVIETASIRAQMEAAKQQVDELVTKTGAALIEATIEAYEAALWLDLEVGKGVMSLLQAANRAYEYLALKPRPMRLVTLRGDNLEGEYNRLLRDAALVLRPDELSREAICEITITRDSHPETFNSLAEGTAIVSLMPEHVPPAQKQRWDERAIAVGIKINGLSALVGCPVALRGTMVSCGIAWFRNKDGAQVSMRVPMRDATDVMVSTDLNLDEVKVSRNLLGVETETVAASPYGLWNVKIPGIQQLLQGEHKDAISLTFCFVGTARVSHNVEALLTTRRAELLPLIARPKHDVFAMRLAVRADAPALQPEQRVSTVENLHAIHPGSLNEEAMLIRMLEDMTYVEIKWDPEVREVEGATAKAVTAAGRRSGPAEKREARQRASGSPPRKGR